MFVLYCYATVYSLQCFEVPDCGSSSFNKRIHSPWLRNLHWGLAFLAEGCRYSPSTRQSGSSSAPRAKVLNRLNARAVKWTSFLMSLHEAAVVLGLRLPSLQSVLDRKTKTRAFFTKWGHHVCWRIFGVKFFHLGPTKSELRKQWDSRSAIDSLVLVGFGPGSLRKTELPNVLVSGKNPRTGKTQPTGY